MGKLRWYKRDPVAALEGMSDLTLEERGAYNTVLDLIYARDGKVDDDDRFIAGWLRCDVRVWRRIKKRLLERGKIYVADGAIHNPRADEEVDEGLQRVASVSEANRTKGIKSGASRRKNKKIDEPKHKPPTNTSTTTTTEDNTSLRSVSSDRVDDGWPADYREIFWQAYPRKLEKKAALLSLERVRKGGAVPWEKLIAAVRGYAATADPQFTKHPTTWLNKGCWDDEAPAIPPFLDRRNWHERPGQNRSHPNPGPPQTHGDAVMAGMARYAAGRGKGEPAASRGAVCGRDDAPAEPDADGRTAGGDREPSRQLAFMPRTDNGK